MRRLQEEAECCATISVTYSSPVSSLHATEPKYTRQDMVTIISGNIEAWVGLSAVHGYLFLEQLYDALLEAQLIRPLRPSTLLLQLIPWRWPWPWRWRWPWHWPTNLTRAAAAFVNFGTFPISILTSKFRAKVGSLEVRRWR